MKNKVLSHKKIAGFTLVELMVAMVLGIVLMGGVATLYLETRRNQGQDDELARLQENARYILELLKHEIASSGFLGGLSDATQLSTGSVSTDCSSSDWALNVSQTLEIVNDVSTSGTPTTASGTGLTCITSSDLQQNSDIIALKRTADTPTLRNGSLMVDGADTNQWYLKSFDFSDYSWSYLTGAIDSSEATAGSTYDYWEYYAKIFYLRDYSVTSGDGIPSLCEARLLESAIDTRCLVEGVENIQFELGVDSNGDGVAEQYLSAPAAADFENAVAVRVHVLMRSVNTISNYTNEKSYQVGSRSIAPYNDAFVRKVFTTTVTLRNRFNS